MNFTLPDELLALQAKTRDFIAEQVIPLENDPRQDSHGPSDALRQDLVARARAAGLLTPHASREMGGLALSHVAKAIVFEEAGYSPLGPVALNIHAPDESNIHLENATFFNYLEPAALAGQSAVQTAVAGEQATTFYYFPGQRRVRRMPSYSYDAPQIGLDNQYTVDEANVFFGTMDRFDWKLIGKQELLVPYNDFGAYDTGAKVETFAGNDSIAPQSRRYELHRVWVVEANVRQGMRHQAPKRMFYIDEDSWNPLLAVDYDKQGQIWKVREGFSIPVYETGACDVQAQVQYNLADGRYLFDMTSIGAGKNDIRWLTEDNGSPRLKRDFFTSDNLRAISER